jgi:hypothetical protein
MLHWGLTAAALLMFAYAVRMLFVSSKAEGDKGKQNLGCGFAVVSAALWIYVLDHHLDDPWPAIRIGLGALLVLPAVQALAKPEGARILRAAVGLALAVVLAGPPLQDLWSKLQPDPRAAEEQEIDTKIEELEARIEPLSARGIRIDELRKQLRDEILATGKNWDELKDDKQALYRLSVIRELDEQRAEVRDALERLASRLRALSQAKAALQAGQEAPGWESEAPDDALIRAMANVPPLDELPPVEQHLRRKELEELFNSGL